MTKQYQEIALTDYTAPLFEIESIDLDVDLFEDHAIVKNSMKIKKNFRSYIAINPKWS